MSSFRYFFYGASLILCIWALPAEAAFKCSKLKDMLPTLFSSGYGWLSTADVPSRGMAILVFLSRSGDYKIIGVDENLNACPLIDGSNWIFVLQQGA